MNFSSVNYDAINPNYEVDVSPYPFTCVDLIFKYGLGTGNVFIHEETNQYFWISSNIDQPLYYDKEQGVYFTQYTVAQDSNGKYHYEISMPKFVALIGTDYEASMFRVYQVMNTQGITDTVDFNQLPENDMNRFDTYKENYHLFLTDANLKEAQNILSRKD